MERKRCWESYDFSLSRSLFASRPAALIAFYFYTLLPPNYASQLVATGTPDSSPGTNTFSQICEKKYQNKSTVQQATKHLGHFCTDVLFDTNAHRRGPRAAITAL